MSSSFLSTLSRTLFVFALALTAVVAWGELALILPHASYADMNAYAADELGSLDIVSNGFAHFGLGYGPTFWGLLAGVLALSPMGKGAMMARAVFVLLKYAAWLVTADALRRWRGPGAASLFLLFVLTTPGFLFFGKVISPEYIVLLFSALSVWFAVMDRGRLGLSYHLSVAVALLGTVTKISLAPFLALLLVYGAVLALRAKKVRPLLTLLKGWVVTVVAVLLPFCLMRAPGQIYQDVAGALAIIPDSLWTQDIFKLAWRRDELTWDQIRVGGLRPDFLPAVLAWGAAIPFMLYALWKKREGVALVLSFWLAAGLMFVSAAVHGSGFGWYLFPSCFLSIAGLALSLPSHRDKAVLALIGACLLVFTLTGHHRFASRIEAKMDLNAQLTSNEARMVALRQDLATQWPCAKTGNVDILIPFPQEWRGVLSMRQALNAVSRGIWSAPDFIVVNGALEAPTPLELLVLKDRIKSYHLARTLGPLRLYLSPELSCSKAFAAYNWADAS